MKIVYLLRDHTNPGGIERVVAQKSNYLVNKGYEVFIVTLHMKEEPPFFHFNREVKFHNLDIGITPGKKKFIDALTRYFSELKPDIVISTGVLITNYLYQVQDTSKKILECHFAKYKKKYKLANLDKYLAGRVFNYIYSYKRTRLAKKYDRFVVLTDEDRRDWGNLKNICTIPNPIPFIPESYSDLTEKRVIAVGRLTGQKGFDLLVQAWAKVTGRFPDWKLSIIGSGGKEIRLRELIEKLGVEKSVDILPPSRDIESEYKKSSIYAFSSRYEGFGLVLAEAMACGLPAVSFACKSGPADIISDGEDGFLIKMHDTNDFAEKLALLMKDKELRQKMGKAARNNILRYTQDKVLPHWEQLFHEIMNK